MWRSILAVAVALVVAYIAVKVVFFVFSVALQAIGWLIMLAVAAAVAIPVYLFVRQKLLAR